MDSPRTKRCIAWIDDNSMDNNILMECINYNNISIEQLIIKYTEKYNETYKKILTSPLTREILEYLFEVYKKYPNTYNMINVELIDGKIINKNKNYVHLGQMITNLKNENKKLHNELQHLKRQLH